MTTAVQLTSKEMRHKVTVTGIVQGVGFRPFVYNLACQHQLSGFVRNLGGAVEIEIQGAPAKIQDFLNQLAVKAPSMSVIDQMKTEQIELLDTNGSNFSIEQSNSSIDSLLAISPDMATCDDCLKELFNPNDRRHRYPFINCTNCGPRFTIIDKLPYDRPSTTMTDFAMCKLCLDEYNDPTNRRFHAQPNACRDCGPAISFVENKTSQKFQLNPESALAKAIDCIRSGGVLAVKGLGGFHIICDALNNDAIARLRQAKRRSEKPLAVMMSDLDMVRKYCFVTKADEDLLNSARRPIVLLPQLKDSCLPDELAPGNAYLGVMLPYTPLHHLLLDAFKNPIVCTSGNLSEEPIATDNHEALARLSSMVDGFLLHNRRILSRYDDSLTRTFKNRQLIIRRSRGYAPQPLNLGFSTSKQVLAFGAHLKNTFCFLKGKHAYLSQHIGDLENLETLQHFQESLLRLKTLFNITPEILACDLHPDYLSTKEAQLLASSLSVPLIASQHHHAHIVSCMVEHSLNKPVIGVAFDGMGYGTDGHIWGGEFLISNLDRFDRAAHLAYVPMPGADLAVRQPWRMAVAHIMKHKETDVADRLLHLYQRQFGENTVSLVLKQLDKQLNSPLTSSCGRLFDAASAALGLRQTATFEGQAAIELETSAYHWLSSQANQQDMQNTFSYPFTLGASIETSHILPAMLIDIEKGFEKGQIAYRFHSTVAQIIKSTCEMLRDKTNINDVCLSGGVFQNQVLLGLTLSLLQKQNFHVFYPQALPTNDGGLSLGQAAIAAYQTDSIKGDA